MKNRIFSGIQPTGIIHIGNYFGAIHNWLDLQKTNNCMFCVVDLHALTVYHDPNELRKNIRQLVKLYIACGIDPEKNIIFVQSDVKEHAELGWILNCITPIAELERMTQFKDKAKEHKNEINAGLFTYPCLMAADILLYDTNGVPVGDDQNQHVELTRTIARKFNRIYGDTFVVPEALVKKAGCRILSLDNPEQKMSKSAKSEYNYIAMQDKPEIIRKKIMSAVTDSGSEVKFGEDKPAISNLLTIFNLISGKPIKEIEKNFAGKGYGDFKKQLAGELVNFLSPIQERFNAIDDNELDAILKKGAEAARKMAEAKMKIVKEKIGLPAQAGIR